MIAGCEVPETDDVWVNLHLSTDRMASARLSEIALIEDAHPGAAEGCRANVMMRNGHWYSVLESYGEIMAALGNQVEDAPG